VGFSSRKVERENLNSFRNLYRESLLLEVYTIIGQKRKKGVRSESKAGRNFKRRIIQLASKAMRRDWTRNAGEAMIVFLSEGHKRRNHTNKKGRS